MLLWNYMCARPVPTWADPFLAFFVLASLGLKRAPLDLTKYLEKNSGFSYVFATGARKGLKLGNGKKHKIIT